MSRKRGLIHFVFALVTLASATSNVCAQQVNCLGKLCKATPITGSAPKGFTITPQTAKDGKGDATVVKGQVVPNCDPCKACKWKIDWSFDGSAFSVRHGDDWTVGGGPANGSVTLTVKCNDPADSVTFMAGGGEATFSLTCPCT
jgi:hypothetical protein